MRKKVKTPTGEIIEVSAYAFEFYYSQNGYVEVDTKEVDTKAKGKVK